MDEAIYLQQYHRKATKKEPEKWSVYLIDRKLGNLMEVHIAGSYFNPAVPQNVKDSALDEMRKILTIYGGVEKQTIITNIHQDIDHKV